MTRPVVAPALAAADLIQSILMQGYQLYQEVRYHQYQAKTSTAVVVVVFVFVERCHYCYQLHLDAA